MKELRPHQIKAIKESPDKWCLFFACRVGKTPTSIRLACERSESALVISPKSIVENWNREIKVWKSGECKIDVIGRETFRRDWDKLPHYEAVIVDEIHQHFSNYKNLAYKSLEKYIKKHQLKYIWLLTGTPMPASCWAVYSYGKLLGKDWGWLDWDRRYFYRVKMGRCMIPMQKDTPQIKKELQVILKKIGTVIDLKDVAGVIDDENVIETFTLNKEQTKLIKEYFDPMPIIRYTAQHQLEQGVKKSNGYEDAISTHCDKDKRLIELVKDTDKVVIVCRYHNQIDKYVDILSKLGRNIYKISGREKLTASQIAPEAENDPSAIVIVQSDTVSGFSLKSFNTMIFASMSFSFVNLVQCKARLKSMDKKIPCQYIYLLTEGDSIDKAIYDCVQKKQDFNIELYKKH